jgi:hypothetical protein
LSRVKENPGALRAGAALPAFLLIYDDGDVLKRDAVIDAGEVAIARSTATEGKAGRRLAFDVQIATARAKAVGCSLDDHADGVVDRAYIGIEGYR